MCCVPMRRPSSSGIGAVLGGGMDLKLGRGFDLRLFEADYVLGRHNFSSLASVIDSSLRHPVLNGVALRTGIVFNIGGGEPAALPAASCSHRQDRSDGSANRFTLPSRLATSIPSTHSITLGSTGGKIEGKETGASIDTDGMAILATTPPPLRCRSEGKEEQHRELVLRSSPSSR